MIHISMAALLLSALAVAVLPPARSVMPVRRLHII
jgi:hypothetical protein